MIIVDTDILVDVIRKYLPALQWLRSKEDEKIAIPGFVAMELIFGCENKVQQNSIEKHISNYNILRPSSLACNQALHTFTQYHLSNDIGIIDSLIAHTIMETNLPLHTFNQKHYKAIPNLKTVQPYKKGNR